MLAGCGGGSKQVATTTTAPAPPTLSFSDPATAPLAYRDRGVVLRTDGVTVHDAGFQSGGQWIDAYVAEDGKKGKHPAVVLVAGGGGDRTQLVGDAVALAKRGIVAITITPPSTSHPPAAPRSNRERVEQAKQVTVADVVAVRRAADAVSALPNVDPQRLGYLGWSNGAKTGTYVAAKDGRFKALVLLSGGADTLAQFVEAAPKSLRPLVRSQLGLIDPLRYIAAVPAGRLLLEDGRSDEVVPQAALLNMIRAAPKGTPVHWYAAGHALDEQAYRAAFAWLALKLGATR